MTLLTPFLRFYFNVMPKDPAKKINSLSLDLFLMGDIFFAIFTLIAFQIISSVDHTFLENRYTKFNLDILVSLVMGVILWKTF